MNLLYLRRSLKGDFQIHSGMETPGEIYPNFQFRCGMSNSQTKRCLLNPIKDPQGSMSEFAVEVSNLVGHAYQYLPVSEIETLTVEHSTWVLNYKALQKHF